MFNINLKAICTASVISRLLFAFCLLLFILSNIALIANATNATDAGSNFQMIAKKSQLVNDSELKIFGKKSLEKKLGKTAKNLEEASYLNNDAKFLAALCKQVKAEQNSSKTNKADMLQNIVAYSTILEVGLASQIANKALNCFDKNIMGDNLGAEAEAEAKAKAESQIYLTIASILNKLDDSSLLDRFLSQNSSIFARISNNLAEKSSPAFGNPK